MPKAKFRLAGFVNSAGRGRPGGRMRLDEPYAHPVHGGFRYAELTEATKGIAKLARNDLQTLEVGQRVVIWSAEVRDGKLYALCISCES